LGIVNTERRPDYKDIKKTLKDKYFIKINYKNIKIVRNYFDLGFRFVELILRFNL